MAEVNIKVSDVDRVVNAPDQPNMVIEIEADPPFPVRQGEFHYKEMTNAQGAAFLMVSEVVGEDAARALIEAGDD